MDTQTIKTFLLLAELKNFTQTAEKLVLVTDYKNKQYQYGIKKAELIKEDYLMCNFALQEVGKFIRELFPRYYQFSFEIDNSTKLIPYLLGGTGYSFLPQIMIETFLQDKKLREVPLLDVQTPQINSYCVSRDTKMAELFPIN